MVSRPKFQTRCISTCKKKNSPSGAPEATSKSLKLKPFLGKHTLKVIHVHHDLKTMFITLVWNEIQSFHLHHFHIIVLFFFFFFVYMYVKFQSITSLLSYSIIHYDIKLYTMYVLDNC